MMYLQELYFYLSKKGRLWRVFVNALARRSVRWSLLVEAFAGRSRAMGAHISFPVLTLCVLDESAETLRARFGILMISPSLMINRVGHDL